nr:LiaF domain-containing protein [uncultured Holophaga sp.]
MSEPGSSLPGRDARSRAYLIGGLILVVCGLLGFASGLGHRRSRQAHPRVEVRVEADDDATTLPSTDTRPASASSDAYFDRSVVLGGIEASLTSQAFTGGRVKAVLGGIELDLTQVRPAQDPVSLEINAVCGGAEIRIPRDWAVTAKVKCVAGGVDLDGYHAPAQPAHHLVLTGELVCGGLEVKN